MSEGINLQAQRRTTIGKHGVRSTREQGYIPGVYYNAKGDNMPVEVRYRALEAAFKRAGFNHVIQLEIVDNKQGKTRPAMIWDVQHHPVKDFILHVDFFGVDMSKEIQVEVPIKVIGEAQGVEEGGQLTLFQHSLQISCLPDAIPEGIAIDVSELGMNENVNIEDVSLPEGVNLVYDGEENFAILGVTPIAEVSLEEEEEEVIEEEPAEEDEE
jgi:large subunit ribosomal protein L25